MIKTNTPRQADSVAETLHIGQRDKGGNDYIMHPRQVAVIVKEMYPSQATDDDVMVALLHDVIEDCDITALTLIKLGFSNTVVDAVVAITKIKKPVYEEYTNYMCRVMSNPIALRVKIADMTHNMDLTRIEEPTAHDLKRQEKYTTWIDILKENAGQIDYE